MSKLICFRLKPWRKPIPGQFIGPAYHFKRAENKTYLQVNSPKTEMQTFRVEVERPRGGSFPYSIYLSSENDASIVARFCWYVRHSLFEEIRIDNFLLRGQGLGCILTNIALRDIFSGDGSLQKIRTTQTLAHMDSTLAIVRLREKFGIDCYQLESRKQILSTFGDEQNTLNIKRAQRSREYYFNYITTGSESYKIFLLKDQQNIILHHELTKDRARLKELIEKHEAYLSLPMYIDPKKVESMEQYTAQLPENPF